MVAKTKITSKSKTNSGRKNVEPLFYIANAKSFKAAKINLLTAKSSVLMSRNFSVKFLDAIEKEELAKQDIKRTLNRIALLLRKIKTALPVVSQQTLISKKKNIVHRAIITKGDSGNSEKTEIDVELDAINQKLKELAGL